ncbi:hypothetical protein ACLKA7_000099 [Drosophila subpalustris]
MTTMRVQESLGSDSVTKMFPSGSVRPGRLVSDPRTENGSDQNYVRESAPSPEMSSKMESGSDQHSILEPTPERQVRKIGALSPVC